MAPTVPEEASSLLKQNDAAMLAKQQTTQSQALLQQTRKALLQDSTGKPLFPMLYKLRQEGRELLDQSVLSNKEWKVSQQVYAKSEQLRSAIQHKNEQWKVSNQVSSAVTQSQTKLKSALKAFQASGESVSTDYGMGKVLSYNETSETYIIQLSFGTLYTHNIQIIKKKLSEQVHAKSEQLRTAIQNRNEQWKVSDQVSCAVTQSQTKLKSAIKSFKASGESVSTDYGMGKVLSYNEKSETFMIQLSFGTLYTRHIQIIKKKKKKAATALELNSAYKSWAESRRYELQLECQQLGIPFTEETMHECFPCLATPKAASTPSLADANGKPLFPLLYKLRQTGQDMVRSSKNNSPCLLCGAMVCANHSSDSFRKQDITLCTTCVEHLEYDYENVQYPEELEKHTHHLIDLYGRSLLLLQYCEQFMLPTAASLEQNNKQHNHIGVGGSSAGVVSGVLGVAAACSILTPAGPPLLIASIVFGGSATAAQAGSEAYKYYSEPNQFANRILTLHKIAQMILQMTRVMRETTLVPYLDEAILKVENTHDDETNHSPHNKAKVAAVRAGTRIGSTAATSAAASLVVQEGALAGRFVSRATTAATRTARFARFAGGALSAATLVLEARELHRTVDQIKLGSPCEKAQSLRTIHANLKTLPTAKYVQRMCKTYVKVRSRELFQQAMTNVQEDLVLVEEVVSSLEAAPDDDESSQSSTSSSKPRLTSRSELLERVKRFKELEAQKELSSMTNKV